MKIYFVPPRLIKQDVISHVAENCFVELNDDHLIWSIDFVAIQAKEEDDKITHEVQTVCESTILKSQITTISLDFLPEGKRWYVTILAKGTSVDYNTFFIRKVDAVQFKKKLVDWLLNKPQ